MDKKETGIAILRVTLGLLFLIPGLMKLFVMGPSGFAGMLSGLGVPAALFFSWIVIIVEILGGLGLILGYKTKLVIWPTLVVIIVAALMVSLPGMSAASYAGPSVVNFLFHIVVIGGLLQVHFTGPGRAALDKE